MCTVTYIPRQKGDFILTSNRDEQASRSPKSLTLTEQDGQELLFPRDTAAGGTWIASSDANRVVCLLNGAFRSHDRRPPYRRSRGLMVLDFFSYGKAEDFFRLYNFQGMEAFTMVIVERGKLWEFRWDEEKQYLSSLDSEKPHIWSSSTLYNEKAKEKRRTWFEAWIKNSHIFNRENSLYFHRTAGDGDPWNDVIMNREGIVQTVSITSILKSADRIDVMYHELLTDQVRTAEILLQSELVVSAEN